MPNNGKMDLRAGRNNEKFSGAIITCERKGPSRYSEYELEFLADQKTAWIAFGSDYAPTVKQWNFLMDMARKV